MAVITWWMLACAVGLLRGSGGVRRGASPSLLGGALAGLGLRDYERDVTEQDPRSRCSNLSGAFRTFDGTCNNANNLGAANTPLARLLPPVYGDGVEAPRTRGRNGRPLRGARRISQLVFPDTSRRGLNTLLLMQWGQFLDHDMTLMPLPTERVREEGGEPIICCGRDRLGLASPQPEDCFPITFTRDPGFLGSCMEFVRTIPATRRNPRDTTEPREQLNSLTAFIDASAVYGSSREEEEELREANGRGYLLKSERSSQGPLLPRTDRGICARERDDPPNTPVCFLAGDERVNEQPDLATIHTIFLRLHNVIASRMAAATPRASLSFNSTVFQSARRVVGAIVQRVMFGEWLPIILGDRVMRREGLSVHRRSDYDPSVDPRILNEFSTAAYRSASLPPIKHQYQYQ
ncbi:hypothetical protein V1264_019758 [Littorina saxatilis]|uniref:Uncharacterized protein n=1 Tax=Littorina saxatilis TaxID=31220 RepID=A0AAN9BA13_9CAEN